MKPSIEEIRARVEAARKLLADLSVLGLDARSPAEIRGRVEEGWKLVADLTAMPATPSGEAYNSLEKATDSMARLGVPSIDPAREASKTAGEPGQWQCFLAANVRATLSLLGEMVASLLEAVRLVVDLQALGDRLESIGARSEAEQLARTAQLLMMRLSFIGNHGRALAVMYRSSLVSMDSIAPLGLATRAGGHKGQREANDPSKTAARLDRYRKLLADFYRANPGAKWEAAVAHVAGEDPKTPSPEAVRKFLARHGVKAADFNA
jgi:hypothetical protein